MESMKNFKKISELIKRAWGQDTIYPGLVFDKNKPYVGQCEPTACLLQDLFGGDIYKIENDSSIAPKKTHYYNCINGHFYDITKEQFKSPVPYENGMILTEKQCNTLRTTSYCNRMSRYICLQNNFGKMDNSNNSNAVGCDLTNVGKFLIDVGNVLLNSPWDEIYNWFPELFRLIMFINDCEYCGDKSKLFDNDIVEIVEHYLEGCYTNDCDEIIEKWKNQIISKNGKTFADFQKIKNNKTNK